MEYAFPINQVGSRLPVRNRAGQVSLEFIFILVIMLMYIQLIIVPSIEITALVATDTTRVGEARFTAEKMANVVQYAAITSGNSKQTVIIFVPEDTELSCNDVAMEISVKVTLEETSFTPTACQVDGDGDDTACTKTFGFPPDVVLDCSGFDNITYSVLKEIVIRKDVDEGKIYIED